MSWAATNGAKDLAALGEFGLALGLQFGVVDSVKLQAELAYRDGLQSGEQRYYDESGKLSRTETYADGARVEPGERSAAGGISGLSTDSTEERRRE